MALALANAAKARIGQYWAKRSPPLWEMLKTEWYLGLTTFGGPNVHFQVFYKMFYEDLEWIDEQSYREMFALTQSLPGAASTKMLFGINVIRFGFLVGVLSFLMWSLPGAIAAYGLAVGVARVKDSLPSPVYALLSGLNSATIGIIALAAVQLSQKAITDKLTRILVFFGGTAGILYNALWYYPVLMVAGGFAAVIWDMRILHKAGTSIRTLILDDRNSADEEATPETEMQAVGGRDRDSPSTGAHQRRRADVQTDQPVLAGAEASAEPPAGRVMKLSWQMGLVIVAVFFGIFVTVMVLRGTLRYPSRGFSLFANLFLAGTIIFGGGPVVIPLLREYVVNEGWVSSRDFLLGLAIIQAFPGPNFNFAVYLGSLAVADTGVNSAAGAVIGYLAIFSPGLMLYSGTLGIWKNMRQHRWVISGLRGINATAVGLVYAAVYRLWEIGYLSPEFTGGASLGQDPWWVVTTVTSFVGGMWFGLKAPYAILLGGVMGMVWYGVVTR